jgi:hypothetical protein
VGIDACMKPVPQRIPSIQSSGPLSARGMPRGTSRRRRLARHCCAMNCTTRDGRGGVAWRSEDATQSGAASKILTMTFSIPLTQSAENIRPNVRSAADIRRRFRLVSIRC